MSFCYPKIEQNGEIILKEFIEKITKELEKRLQNSREYRIMPVTVRKNNNTLYHGIRIQKEREQIAPVLYLDHFYTEYQDGRSLSDIMDAIYGALQDKQTDEIKIAESFEKYEKIKDRVCCKLIHYERNRELLEEIPYIPFLDLAIVFYCAVEIGNQKGSIEIHNEHIKMWGITKEELYDDAKVNMERLLPPLIMHMDTILKELIQEVNPSEDTEEIQKVLDSQKEDAMYILTNQEKMNGAISILYSDIEQFFPQKDCDYYVLPSSIHELILIPAERKGEEILLQNMVREVNATQVAPEEVLSDTIYYYSSQYHQLYNL